MLRIRLRRTGAKKKPTYRVVVADARAPRDGAFLDILGHYNPRTDPTTFVIDTAKAQRWLANGAQPTDRVARLLKREGLAGGTTAGAEAPASAPAAEAPAEKPAAASRRRSTATASDKAATAAKKEAAEQPAAAEQATAPASSEPA